MPADAAQPLAVSTHQRRTLKPAGRMPARLRWSFPGSSRFKPATRTRMISQPSRGTRIGSGTLRGPLAAATAPCWWCPLDGTELVRAECTLSTRRASFHIPAALFRHPALSNQVPNNNRCLQGGNHNQIAHGCGGYVRLTRHSLGDALFASGRTSHGGRPVLNSLS